MLSHVIQASATERRSFAPGEAIFNEGDDGAEMFAIEVMRALAARIHELDNAK